MVLMSAQRRLAVKRLVAIAAVASAAFGAGTGAALANSPVPACPAPMTCTYKPQMIIDTVPGIPLHSQWAISDGYGAPIAWVNMWGFYFLGDGTGHRGVQGEHICITYNLEAGHEAACLLSDGTLELRATGPRGSLGPPQFLTARDIAWIHGHGG
jgi:hypothetical protein